jgi:integration host factor subunit alpha
MKFTKKQIARSIRQQTGIPIGQSYQLVETTLETIKNTLASGEDVMISGFGKFKVNEKAARRGRNPQTGKDLMLKPRKVVTFGCSGKLRKMMNTKT